MINSFNYSLQNERLSISQRQGVINLIPKKKKNPLLIENWRPISLLNTDYKIATKAIANRIEITLSYIINTNQTGYVKKRYIGENIRLISDMLYYTLQQNIPGAAIFVDFRKAFDSIEWSFIFDVLEQFNFGPQLISWVKVFYTDISSCVINNGFASECFPLHRGVRQGCPLSGPLFVLAVEILAYAINNNTEIKGIKIRQKEIKLCQYADDTTCFLEDSESIKNLLSLLEKFKIISGLEPNIDKTEAMWIGSMKSDTYHPFGLKWTTSPILALGIYFGYDQKLCDKLNFHEKLNRWKKCFSFGNSATYHFMGKLI
ncbi:MAG: hypothetical protein DSY43_00290 [Gammaproteobacteria bacterium]|nr:MAG: hypothetical protein DSY43_00290 [Gammaproteobacteria bacterium]